MEEGEEEEEEEEEAQIEHRITKGGGSNKPLASRDLNSSLTLCVCV